MTDILRRSAPLRAFSSVADKLPFHIIMVALATSLLMLFGLFRSLQATLAMWGPDADTADLAMLWFGVQRHGLGFLRYWYYTQDNWLLTLVPAAFAVFAILGARPVLVILSGWVIFVGCVTLALIISKHILPKRYVIALGPLLILSNTNILGNAGFFTYSIEHNSSLLLGLAATLATMRWLRRGRYTWLAMCFFLLVIGAVSDPWVKAAFMLPLLAATLLCSIICGNHMQRWRLAVGAATICVAGGVAQTKLLGFLDFLPNDTLPLADWTHLNGNFVAYCNAISLFFNPVPGMSQTWPISDVVICAIVSGSLAVMLGRLIRDATSITLEQALASTVMVLSCGIVTLAFLIGVWQNTYVAPRFLLNIYVFAPILFCLGLSRTRHRRTAWHVAAVSFASMVMIAGAFTNFRVWWRWPQPLQTLGTVEWATFLKAHNLHYGYGPYWATQANGVTWVSREDVLIRPVRFDSHTGRVAPRLGQTSVLWYTHSDHVGADRTTFVIVTNDPENCADLSVCMAGVQNQYGRAKQVLTNGDARILVWSHDLDLPMPPLPGSTG